jgi:hypothetical protein
LISQRSSDTTPELDRVPVFRRLELEPNRRGGGATGIFGTARSALRNSPVVVAAARGRRQYLALDLGPHAEITITRATSACGEFGIVHRSARSDENDD